MVMTLRFRPRPLVMLVAATASGGETMAPSTNANGQGKPGIRKWVHMETAAVVKNTNAIASVEMGRASALKSCHEVFDAASYRIGGRKIKNTTSGFRVTAGIKGMNATPRPHSTRKTGWGS